MNTILTDDEIRSAITEALKLKPTGLEEIAARAVEAAVLAKLAQQEPAGHLRADPDDGHVFEPRVDGDWSALGKDLYLHPAPQQADRQRVPDEQEVRLLLNRFERQVHRMGELWERCQGKGWPASESDEFAILRDAKTPKTRAALIALLAAAPEAPAQAVPDAMKTVIAAMQSDPDYAWSWHCNVAMGFVDAGGDPYTANQGAARFMRVLANVEPAHALPESPAQASAVDEREAFEAWIQSEVSGEWIDLSPMNGANGRSYSTFATYRNKYVEALWSAWQARSALAQKGGAA